MEDQTKRSVKKAKWVKNILQTDNRTKITNWVAYVKIAQTAKEHLQRNGVSLITSKEMVEALLDWLKKSYPQRKGVHREPLLWLLQTMMSDNLIRARL